MSDERPNFLFILTDQQRWDTIGALGYDHMHTPHLDSLAESGVAFTQAYCPGVTCVPSRAAMFTGRYPHNTGCYTFHPWAHHRNLVHELRNAGYWCVNIGKMHLIPQSTDGGFHERTIVENPTNTMVEDGKADDDWGRFLSFHGQTRPNHRQKTDPEWDRKFQCVPWHLEERYHSDVFTGDSAVSWIRNYADGKQPFFLEVGLPGPHEPWDPPQRLVDLYAEDVGPLPPSIGEDLSGKPPQHAKHREFMANAPGEARIQMQSATEDDVRKMRQHYFGNISLVDEQIGKILAALEERGLSENTVIVMSSDHGEMLGEHGMAYKWLFYDPIVHVPLIVVDPRNPERAGQRCNDLVSLIDLAPTFLDYAGASIPDRMEGQSLRRAAEGAAYPAREVVYAEDNYVIMARWRDRKLVYYLGQEEGEYYRLDEDPWEMKNLWNDPGAREEIQKGKATILEWMAGSCYHQTGYRCGREDANGHYTLRWPRPEEEDFYLHGPNAKPPLKPYH